MAGLQHNGNSTIESSLLHASLREQQVNREDTVALCFLVPFILDGLSDMMERWFFNDMKKDTATELLNTFEKMCLFVGFAIAPLLAFVSPDSYESMALLWLCLSRFQTIIVLGTLHISFCRSNGHTLSWWMSSKLSLTILTVALNIGTWTSIIGNDASDSATIASTILTAVVLAMIVVPVGLWLLRKCIVRYNYHTKVKPNNNDNDNGNENLDNVENNWTSPDFYLLFGSSSYVIILVTSLVLGPTRHFTTPMLWAYKWSFIIVEVLLLFFYLRKNKYDSIHNLSVSIETRKQYLRYIAHEIRTPLNSAVLGLKLICDSLATIENKGIVSNSTTTLTLPRLSTLTITIFPYPMVCYDASITPLK